MKASFIDAGFDENRCCYTVFDNTSSNVYDPYRVIKIIQETPTEPYIVLCHQDILLDRGDGFEKLVKVIEELNNLDHKWAVLGNAGFNDNHQQIVRIKDPHDLEQWTGSFPQKVHSLDENFLVIKASTNVYPSEELRGFHLYATDLCLNAALRDYSCYVIDFYITHLSSGTLDRVFWDACKSFHERWNQEFGFYFIKTTGSIPMLLSKHKILLHLFSKGIGEQILTTCIRLRKKLKIMIRSC